MLRVASMVESTTAAGMSAKGSIGGVFAGGVWGRLFGPRGAAEGDGAGERRVVASGIGVVLAEQGDG